MSNTASGRITGPPGTRFTASFILPDTGMQVNFLGTLSSSVEACSCSNATLTYDSISQLTAARQFEGQVGETSFQITTSNGPVIEGVLDMPLSPASRVSGTGVWASN